MHTCCMKINLCMALEPTQLVTNTDDIEQNLANTIKKQ